MNGTAFISLGSNMGDRSRYLESAIKSLNKMQQIEVVNVSSLYETDPVGYEEQDLFLNMVAEIRTSLSPHQLLENCMRIEGELERKREIRWGPRTIDLDILLFNDENIITESLTIPHPRLHERAFVVIPLLEICPKITLPTMERPLCEMVKDFSDRGGVRIWRQKNGEDVFALFES